MFLRHDLFFFFCAFVFLCSALLLPLFLVGFISSLPQLTWDKRLPQRPLGAPERRHARRPAPRLPRCCPWRPDVEVPGHHMPGMRGAATPRFQDPRTGSFAPRAASAPDPLSVPCRADPYPCLGRRNAGQTPPLLQPCFASKGSRSPAPI
jgi:hypothetical protein